MVRDGREVEGLYAEHLLRTFQGESCARKRQMRVAVKGSTGDEARYEKAYLVFCALCIQHGNEHISVTVAFRFVCPKYFSEARWWCLSDCEHLGEDDRFE